MSFLIWVALLTAAPAGAKEDRTACKAAADCATAEDPCGKARPLNKKYMPKLPLAIQPLIECPAGAKSEAELFRADCREGRCVLEKAAEAPAE